MPEREQLEPVSLRIPSTLRERIRRQAVANRRSLNAEMLVLMEAALPAGNEKAETAATVPAE